MANTCTAGYFTLAISVVTMDVPSDDATSSQKHESDVFVGNASPSPEDTEDQNSSGRPSSPEGRPLAAPADAASHDDADDKSG